MDGTPRGESDPERTARPYGIGLVLALILTTLAFAVAGFGTLSHNATLAVIFSAAGAQVLVHLRYFLHLRFSTGSRGHVGLLLLAVLIMGLIVGGTLWIMRHLDYNLS